MPKISVIMSIYREPIDWIRLSIESILNQTFRDFEFIIINDNPSRIENKELLAEYNLRDSRIIGVTNETNIGLTKSLNKCLQIAKGEYIVRMDADDISLPNRLYEQYTFMSAHPNLTLSGTNAYLFGNLSLSSSRKLIMPDTSSKIQIFSLFLNPLIHPSVIFRKEHLHNLMYNEDCKRGQDYEFWVRLMALGHIIQNNNNFLLKYRKVDKGLNYFLDQNQTANIARVQSLANNLGEDYAREHSDIHIYVCGGMSNKPYSIREVELYLEDLKSMLLQKYNKEDKRWLLQLIGYIWQLNCTRTKQYLAYFRSPLYAFLSFKDFLMMSFRFFANILLK